MHTTHTHNYCLTLANAWRLCHSLCDWQHELTSSQSHVKSHSNICTHPMQVSKQQMLLQPSLCTLFNLHLHVFDLPVPLWRFYREIPHTPPRAPPTYTPKGPTSFVTNRSHASSMMEVTLPISESFTFLTVTDTYALPRVEPGLVASR